MYAWLKEWMKQVTSVIGAGLGSGTVVAALLGQVNWHQAAAPAIMSLVMLVLKDNTNAKAIGTALTADVFDLTDKYRAGQAKMGGQALLLLLVPTIGAVLLLSACSGSNLTAALQSPAGQLFCAVDTGGGGQLVVGVIDGEATAKLGAAAPVAVVATGAAATVVQSECIQAAVAMGAKAAAPVSPPATAVPNVAIQVPAAS